MKKRNMKIWAIVFAFLILYAVNYCSAAYEISLSTDIKNKNPPVVFFGIVCDCEDTVKWYVQKDCAGEFTEVSCRENQGLILAGDETKTVTCTSGDIPNTPGTHCVKIEWCGSTTLEEYSLSELPCDSCESCTEAIGNAKAGDVVKLTADIDDHDGTCITWDNNDVTFDCQGHYIDGDGDFDGGGIEVEGDRGNTIRNCEIKEFCDGILLSHSSDNAITGNTANSNLVSGIYLIQSSDDNAITGNTANSNRHGLYIRESSNNKITGNTANSNGGPGIYLIQSSDNTITGNTANSNRHGLYIGESSNNKITGNTANSNGGPGIYMIQSSDNTITDNTVNQNSEDGITLHSSSTKNKITGNTVCQNNQKDISVSSDSSVIADSDGNTCDVVENYNDQGETGCTNPCTIAKLTLLFIPVNWDSGMTQFDSDADNHANFLLNNLPLKDCPEKFKVIKSHTNCLINFGSCTADEQRNVLREIKKCADKTGEQFNYAIGLEDSDVCGIVAGFSDAAGGLPTVFSENSYESNTAHELGHEFGLADEYYDACRCCSNVGGPLPCSANPSANCLKASLGGNEPSSPYSADYCAGGNKCPAGFAVTCYGNKNPQGGRCIMSAAPRPEAFCDECMNHLKKNPRLTCN